MNISNAVNDIPGRSPEYDHYRYSVLDEHKNDVSTNKYHAKFYWNGRIFAIGLCNIQESFALVTEEQTIEVRI